MQNSNWITRRAVVQARAGIPQAIGGTVASFREVTTYVFEDQHFGTIRRGWKGDTLL